MSTLLVQPVGPNLAQLHHPTPIRDWCLHAYCSHYFPTTNQQHIPQHQRARVCVAGATKLRSLQTGPSNAQYSTTPTPIATQHAGEPSLLSICCVFSSAKRSAPAHKPPYHLQIQPPENLQHSCA
jgi:hypothetical protein